MTTLLISLLAGAAAWWALSHSIARSSQRMLAEMRDAFAFLQDYGMKCTSAVNRGMGATVEFRGAELWLNVYCDRGDYYWEFGLVAQPDYCFEPRHFCETLAQAEQFGSNKSVRDLGDATRKEFGYFVAAIKSEKASSIVQRRKETAAGDLRELLENDQ